MEMIGENLGRPSENLRKLLIQQELRMRKRQPEHWAKTKYRKYAKPYTEQELALIKELEKKRKKRVKKAGKRRKGKAQGKWKAKESLGTRQRAKGKK